MSPVPLGLSGAILSFLVVCCLLFPLRAQAQLPETMGYQGFLTDPSGTPINDTMTSERSRRRMFG